MHKAPAREKTGSGVMTPESGASRFAPPLNASIRLSLAKSDGPIPAIIAQAIREQARYNAAKATEAAVRSKLSGVIEQLQVLAKSKDWSQRQLARETHLPPRTLRRIRDGEIASIGWLHKLQSALSRLNPS